MQLGGTGGIPVMSYGAAPQHTVQVTRYGTTTTNGGIPASFVTPQLLTTGAPTTMMHTSGPVRLVGQPTVYTTSQPTAVFTSTGQPMTHGYVTGSTRTERIVHPPTITTTTYGDPNAYMTTNGAMTMPAATTAYATPQLITADQSYTVDPSAMTGTIAQVDGGWDHAALVAAAAAQQQQQQQQQQTYVTAMQPMVTTVPMGQQQAFVSGSKTVKQWVNGQLVNSETQNW